MPLGFFFYESIFTPNSKAWLQASFLAASPLPQSGKLFCEEILQRHGRTFRRLLVIVKTGIAGVRVGERMAGLAVVDQLPVQFGGADFIDEAVDLLARH